ncbi:hypothetical protein BDZ89DRAFT_1253151 [Hymenopellis radicata]|nr:hypothetical protein BDZ89DRAFT_1253151 [Hymenopellis radicata]
MPPTRNIYPSQTHTRFSGAGTTSHRQLLEDLHRRDDFPPIYTAHNFSGTGARFNTTFQRRVELQFKDPIDPHFDASRNVLEPMYWPVIPATYLCGCFDVFHAKILTSVDYALRSTPRVVRSLSTVFDDTEAGAMSNTELSDEIRRLCGHACHITDFDALPGIGRTAKPTEERPLTLTNLAEAGVPHSGLSEWA